MRKIIVLALLAAAPIVHAASFDCRKELNRIEQQICWDPELSRLDYQLDEGFSTLALSLSAHDRVTREQRAWLGRRNACGTMECIRLAYVERIAEVEGQIREELPELAQTR